MRQLFAFIPLLLFMVSFALGSPDHAGSGKGVPSSLEGVLLEFVSKHADDTIHVEQFYVDNHEMYYIIPHTEDVTLRHQKPCFVKVDENNSRRVPLYVDSRGWYWNKCVSYFYIGKGDEMLLYLDYQPRHRYILCRSAWKSDEKDYDEWIYSLEPAILHVKKREGHRWEARATGVMGSLDMAQPPAGIESVTILI